MKSASLQIHKLFRKAAAPLAEVRGDLVLQNTLYQIVNTVIMAAFGFVFWLISARLYSTEQIGLGSTLINATVALSFFSLLGFDNVLLRYLPEAKDNAEAEKIIDSSIIATSGAALVIGSLFLLVLPIISPSLHAVLHSPLAIVFYLITMVVLTLNTLTDNIFLSFQSGRSLLQADLGLSVSKVFLPVILVSFGALGIFVGYGFSVAIATALSMLILARRFSYHFKPILHRPTLSKVKRFSAAAYIANVAGVLPQIVLPIMATNTLGASSAAFFNLAMTIAAVIFMVPRASSNSLFAAGAKDMSNLPVQFMRTARHITILVVPSVLAAIVLAPYVLAIFGHQYALGATSVLQILAISAFAMGYNTIGMVTLKIYGRLKQLIALEITATLIMLSACIPLMHLYGIKGVALAWLAGQVIQSLLLALFMPTSIKTVMSKSAITKSRKAQTAEAV